MTDLLSIAPRDKAEILAQALPYIRKFHGKTMVIKYGGNAMTDPALQADFAEDVVLLKLVGMNPVVVHGGGPQIETALNRLGKKGEFIQGMRVTDAETMAVVEMVLVGHVNKEVVGYLNQHGGKAIGLCGKDGTLLLAKKLLQEVVNEAGHCEQIDIGYVGDVVKVNTDLISVFEKGGYLPVIAPVGVGPDGESYNINADVVAGRVAAALNAEKLILLTDTPGVLDADKKLIPNISVAEMHRLIAEEAITGGMIPKVACCADALQDGVKKAHIIDGRVEHAVLLEIFTDIGIGTEISK